MPINFCHSILSPKVVSSCSSNEDYDVTNLISSNTSKYSRGFLAYVVVKPPVYVEFEFVCQVNVSHIVIWPQVGSQKSSGLELLSKQKNASSNERIGSVVLQDSERGVVFHHTDFKGDTFPPGFVRKKFSSRLAPLRNIKKLIIRIFKTSGSVPALGRVEVWGWINLSTPVDLRSKVLKLWNSRDCQTVSEKSGSQISSKSKENQPKRVPNSRNNQPRRTASCMPDDFLDCLTYEVMTLPMILPCGKIVDKSTLEKHEQCEASWGRSPSDPFTGRLFTKDSHPVLAASLKARVDKFLVENADKEEVRYLPRTSGRFQYVEPAIEIGEMQSQKLCGGKRETGQPDGAIKNKRQKISTPALAGSPSDDDDSLDCALKTVLSGLPSFVTPATSKIQVSLQCGVCNARKELFKLPCCHFLCRMCLMKCSSEKNLSCRMCGKVFNNSDPIRYHS